VLHHKEKKGEIESAVGPGTYYNNKTYTDFKKEVKPEYLQFFGSTQE